MARVHCFHFLKKVNLFSDCCCTWIKQSNFRKKIRRRHTIVCWNIIKRKTWVFICPSTKRLRKTVTAQLRRYVPYSESTTNQRTRQIHSVNLFTLLISHLLFISHCHQPTIWREYVAPLASQIDLELSKLILIKLGLICWPAYIIFSHTPRTSPKDKIDGYTMWGTLFYKKLLGLGLALQFLKIFPF